MSLGGDSAIGPTVLLKEKPEDFCGFGKNFYALLDRIYSQKIVQKINIDCIFHYRNIRYRASWFAGADNERMSNPPIRQAVVLGTHDDPTQPGQFCAVPLSFSSLVTTPAKSLDGDSWAGGTDRGSAEAN